MACVNPALDVDKSELYHHQEIVGERNPEIELEVAIGSERTKSVNLTQRKGNVPLKEDDEHHSELNLENVPDINHRLLYGVDDEPPWYLTFALGFQHFLSMFCATVSVPFILTPALCMEETDPSRSHLVSTTIFVSGLITLLQCTFGVRLPIVQGTTVSFLIPTFAILNLPEWKCPAKEVLANMTYEDKTEVWQLRMREIQGAIILSSFFQMALGFLGIIGLVLRFITPLTIAPAITMIGLFLFRAAGNLAGKHWGISGLEIVLIIIFSQYMRRAKIPFPFYTNGKWRFKRLGLFELLPILLSTIIVWGLCAILTICGVLKEDSPVRTDSRIQILHESPWFRFPYPGQWGVPTVSFAAVFGMIAGVLSSAIESIGDYYACARLSGARPPPSHAMNRGIGIEGFGCLLAGFWGTGNGTTSYSDNIGAIAITRVGSRRVIQAAAVLMLIFGLLSKCGALFITIPDPIMGGMFCVMFSLITAAGLSNLQFVELNSSRNLLIFGFSIFFSLVLSQWMTEHSDVIQTGYQLLDQIVTILLSTSMFIAMFIGCVLDNTIPGTEEERGLTKWLQKPGKLNDEGTNTRITLVDTYDLPYVTSWLKKQPWAENIPFLPTYKEWQCCSCSYNSNCCEIFKRKSCKAPQSSLNSA